MSGSWPLVAATGLLGLCIGSFLNVVIHRVPRHESLLSPGSHCPACDAPVRARHNVPVLSWLVLRGRCAACHVRISARYPLVEAGTMLLFAAVALHFGATVQLPAHLYFVSIGVALVMIDVDVRQLPDAIVVPSYVVGLLLLIPSATLDAVVHNGERAAVGMVLLPAILATVAIGHPDLVGRDKVKLAGLLGVYLGWISWGAVLIGAVTCLALVALAAAASRLRRRPPHRALLIGPPLIASTALAVLLST